MILIGRVLCWIHTSAWKQEFIELRLTAPQARNNNHLHSSRQILWQQRQLAWWATRLQVFSRRPRQSLRMIFKSMRLMFSQGRTA